MAGRIRIGVVYGGRSSEHPISVVSAGSVLSALDPEKYDVVTIGITRSGAWVRTEASTSQMSISQRQLPEVVHPETATMRRDGKHATVFSSISAISIFDDLDVVFPVLHGAYGEDGTIQGLCEMAGVPYVGSGVLASAAAMDKAFAKVALAAAGLAVGRYVTVRRGEDIPHEQLTSFGIPLFVKPARSGSSVGITKVNTLADLEPALQFAFEHDEKVLIEAAVAGRELECGVLQDADGTVRASVPAEIVLHPDFDWYSFEAKYLDDACEFVIPPKLSDAEIAEIQTLSVRAFKAMDCAGLARVDFFLGEDGPIVNEVNTMPGFTSISMYPRMWAATGVQYRDLIDRLIATALAR